MSIRKQTLSRLRTIVHELYEARYEGASAGRIYRAQGMADGYMRALIDLGVAREAELLALIDEEQRIAANLNLSFLHTDPAGAQGHPRSVE